MLELIPAVVALVFCLLAGIHFYWALGGRFFLSSAVPESGGKPAFVPSTLATVMVALGLTLCAALVMASAGMIGPARPAQWTTWVAFALSAALLARAVGDFRLVGFFKRVRGSRFARMDTLVYAPLCLLLAAGMFHTAWVHRV